MAIGFNSSGVNGLTPLVPVNGGFSGKLSADGNVCNDEVDPIGTKSFSSTGPGTDYETRQLTGTRGRLVRWRWRIKATSVANMNIVEGVLAGYVADGRPYALEDNDGRTTSRAVLLGPEDGTRIIRQRRVVVGGAVIATWQLVFRVLVAATGSGEL